MRAGVAILITSTAVLFGYFAIPGFEESDPVSQFIAGTSVMVVPVVVIALWRRVVTEGLNGHYSQATPS